MASVVQGVGRATRHSLTLPASGSLPELALDLLVAPPIDCDGHAPAVLYVLDPEPVLFGAACLHVYAGSGYFAGAPETAAESSFRSLAVIGIGHAREAFASTASGWDATALRSLRRRDLPPIEHPSIAPGRHANPSAARLVDGILTHVFDYVEQTLLGLGDRAAKGATTRPRRRCSADPNPNSDPDPDPKPNPGRPRRALLGASYTASLALQVLLRDPGAVDDYILGSPSVPFDPEILRWLQEAQLTPSAAQPSTSAQPSTVAQPTDTTASTSEPCCRGAALFIAYGGLEVEGAPPNKEGLEVDAALRADQMLSATAGTPGLTCVLANVHRGIPDAAHTLALVLRRRGLAVDGAHEIEGEHEATTRTLSARP